MTTPPTDLAAQVRRDGAGFWPSFVSGEALAELRGCAARLAAGSDALHFPTSTRVWDLFRHDKRFIDTFERPGLEEVLDDLLGPGHLLSDHSLNVVSRSVHADRWHLDYPYNEMRDLTAGPLLAVQCVLTLDDFTADNGATRYVPGSHRPPRRPDPAPGDHGRPVLASAGTLVILAAATWHRSGVNITGRPRAAILLSFVEGWIRPMTGPFEPGPWSRTGRTRRLLGLERSPETIDGHPVNGPVGDQR